MSITRRPSLKPYREISLPEILAESAGRFQDKIAAVHGSRTATFKELNARCTGIASGLAERGVQPGQRVALMGQNSIEYITAFFAILKAGGVIVPFSPAYSAREISAQLADSGPSAAIVDADLMESFVKAGGDSIAGEKRFSIGKSSGSPGPLLADFDTIRERAVSLPP